MRRADAPAERPILGEDAVDEMVQFGVDPAVFVEELDPGPWLSNASDFVDS